MVVVVGGGGGGGGKCMVRRGWCVDDGGERFFGWLCFRT